MRSTLPCRLLVASAVGGALALIATTSPSEAAGTEPSGRAALVSDHGGTTLFDPGRKLVPGATLQECVTVSAEGLAHASSVHLWADGVEGPLAQHLVLQVDVGTGGGRSGCESFHGREVFSGTLALLAASTTGGGVDSRWTPVGRDLRTFRFTVRVTDDAPQGQASGAVFVWQNSWEPDLTLGPRPTTDAPAPPPDDPGADAPSTSSDRPPTPAPAGPPVTSPPGPGGDGAEAARPTTPTASHHQLPRPTRGAGSGPAGVPPTARDDARRADVELTDTGAAQRFPWTRHVDATRVVPTLRAMVENPVYPLAVLVSVLVFLAVQHHLDARDPKLALAPTYRTLLLFTHPLDPTPEVDRPHPEA